MRARKSGLFAAVLAEFAATPALADEWWLVFMGGEKPARLVVAVGEDYISQPGFFGGVFKLETLAILAASRWGSATAKAKALRVRRRA